MPSTAEITDVSVTRMDTTTERYVRWADGSQWDVFVDGEYVGTVDQVPYTAYKPAPVPEEAR